VRDSGAALVVDGGNSMGQIATAFAARVAVLAARRHGVAAVAIRGSNHCGALAYYTRRIAAEEMIGLCVSNALPTMAPWGGVDKIVGMNPLSIAIPADREAPVVFDAAFAASSHGKIRVYDQKGIAIPAGWAYDAEGQPTTDPAAGLVGLLQPIGGHKGVALAMSMGILSTLLSGAAYGTELGNMVDGPRAGADGQLVLALNVAAFEDPQVFKRRVDAVAHEVHASRRAPGVDRLYVPGELEAETARLYAAEGIPLNDTTLDGLRQQAAKLGVDVAQYLPALTSS
jgi:LDH2 family malate/lactate/ureidoglycolate dehydrogenase